MKDLTVGKIEIKYDDKRDNVVTSMQSPRLDYVYVENNPEHVNIIKLNLTEKLDGIIITNVYARQQSIHCRLGENVDGMIALYLQAPASNYTHLRSVVTSESRAVIRTAIPVWNMTASVGMDKESSRLGNCILRALAILGNKSHATELAKIVDIEDEAERTKKLRGFIGHYIEPKVLANVFRDLLEFYFGCLNLPNTVGLDWTTMPLTVATITPPANLTEWAFRKELITKEQATGGKS